MYIFQAFFVILLDCTLWNKSRHCQFHWVCASHLEYVKITGI